MSPAEKSQNSPLLQEFGQSCWQLSGVSGSPLSRSQLSFPQKQSCGHVPESSPEKSPIQIPSPQLPQSWGQVSGNSNGKLQIPSPQPPQSDRQFNAVSIGASQIPLPQSV